MRSVLLMLLIGFLSCASPQKNLDKGNFRKAYNGALSELEKGKRGKNKDILNRAFNEMVKSHLTDYELLMRTNDLEKMEVAFNKREDVIINYLKGKRWLSDDFDTQLNSFETEQVDLQNELVLSFKSLGDEALDVFYATGDKLPAQDAFGFYNKALQFDNTNEELQLLSTKALQAGTVFILFEVDIWDFSHQWDIDRRFEDIEDESEGFYQIYYEQIIPQVDCRVEVDFNNLDVSNNRETEIREFTDRIQDGFETVIDTSGKTRKEPKYVDISGSVTIVKEIKNYTWQARVRTDRINNYCDFRSHNFETAFGTERVNFNLSGDTRAIPNEYKNQSQNNFRDDEDDIIDEMIDDMYNQIVRYYF